MKSSRPSSVIHFQNPDPPRCRLETKSTYIVFFVTGNPGLVEYYRSFLTHLYALLSSSSTNSSRQAHYQVYGRSLSGFEVDGEHNANNDSNGTENPPYSLQDQIHRTEKALQDVVKAAVSKGISQPRVILIGHSVGSYILLELVRRSRARLLTEPDEYVHIVGGICLFPTVTHIAKSRSGRRGGWLLRRSHFALTASIFVKFILFAIPTAIVRLLIQVFMSFPKDAASVTAAFVKSKHGVRQALHMARDEMYQITSDTWDSEIWGAARPSPVHPSRPVLRFLFGKEDHWVANETRDDLIRARASSSSESESNWKPKMEIDEHEGWPHGFCIKHSIPVAEKVRGYVDEIVEICEGRD